MTTAHRTWPHRPAAEEAGETPLPDWTPWAVPSGAAWREVQRRRNLIQMVRRLAEAARDEAQLACAAILFQTVDQLQATLLRADVSPPAEARGSKERRDARLRV